MRNCDTCFWNPKNIVEKYGEYPDAKHVCKKVNVICDGYLLDADYSNIIKDFMKSEKIDSLGTYQLK